FWWVVHTQIVHPLNRSLHPLRFRLRILRVRLSPKAIAVDAVLLDLVTEYSFGGIEQLRGALAVAAGGLESVLNEIAFISADRSIERKARDGAGSFGSLQRRRQVMPVNDAGLAHQDGAFHNVLQLAYVARPVITRQHVDRRRGNSFDRFAMFAREFFQEMIRQ